MKRVVIRGEEHPVGHGNGKPARYRIPVTVLSSTRDETGSRLRAEAVRAQARPLGQIAITPLTTPDVAGLDDVYSDIGNPDIQEGGIGYDVNAIAAWYPAIKVPAGNNIRQPLCLGDCSFLLVARETSR